MQPKEIKPGVYYVGVIDWDRRVFDALIPLPDGTSYNSFLIKGSEKTALIDTVDPANQDTLLEKLQDSGISKLDYIIVQHAEQDHSGTIPIVMARYPEAQVLCNPRCKGLLIDLLPIPEDRITTVNDKETISLGDKTLEFIYTPWVHWPETMCTHLREDGILFSCDFFGSHLATTDTYVKDDSHVAEAAKRYYAEIMMPYRAIIEKNLQKLAEYKFEMIATSHGPIYGNPEFIIKAYHSWVFDKPRNSVVIPYTSMHGSTRKMVEHLVNSLSVRGVFVQQLDLAVTDVGKLAIALVEAATIVVGTPTVLAGPHPNVVTAVFLANALRPKAKFASIIGSYGWGGRTVEIITSMLPNLKVEVIEPILVKGVPLEADYKALDNMAETIAAKHKENGFA